MMFCFFPLGEEGWATNIKVNRRRKEKVQGTVLCLQSYGKASSKCLAVDVSSNNVDSYYPINHRMRPPKNLLFKNNRDVN